MTLLDAAPYDPERARRRRNIIIYILIACAVAGFLVYHFWNWREEHLVNQFFTAVEARDMPKAFGIWNNDPNWEKHPQKYSAYPYGRFLLDWGKSSDWGIIKTHKIVEVKSVGNGVVLGVDVNGDKTPIYLWVERSKKTLAFSPFNLSTG